MANLLIPAAKKALLDGDWAWDSSTIKLALMDDAYVFSSAHDFFDDVSANVIASSAALTGKTTTAGVADADDVVFAGIAAAENIEGIWIYVDSGVAATSQLLVWLDTRLDDNPIDETTTGDDVTVFFDNGASKIFAL
jgi:hypothetical protein